MRVEVGTEVALEGDLLDLRVLLAGRHDKVFTILSLESKGQAACGALVSLDFVVERGCMIRQSKFPFKGRFTLFTFEGFFKVLSVLVLLEVAVVLVPAVAPLQVGSLRSREVEVHPAKLAKVLPEQVVNGIDVIVATTFTVKHFLTNRAPKNNNNKIRFYLLCQHCTNAR